MLPASTEARKEENGRDEYGREVNRREENGREVNGREVNGREVDGREVDGREVNGREVNRREENRRDEVEKIETEKKHRRNEIILFGIVILAAVLYLLWQQKRPAQSGGEVVVQAEGEEYARLPLSKDTELDIVQGERYNHLVIRGGVATVTEATCPDKQCVHQADISRNGEMIVCLPNQVLITIENGVESELDSVVK